MSQEVLRNQIGDEEQKKIEAATKFPFSVEQYKEILGSLVFNYDLSEHTLAKLKRLGTVTVNDVICKLLNDEDNESIVGIELELYIFDEYNIAHNPVYLLLEAIFGKRKGLNLILAAELLPYLKHDVLSELNSINVLPAKILKYAFAFYGKVYSPQKICRELNKNSKFTVTEIETYQKKNLEILKVRFNQQKLDLLYNVLFNQNVSIFDFIAFKKHLNPEVWKIVKKYLVVRRNAIEVEYLNSFKNDLSPEEWDHIKSSLAISAVSLEVSLKIKDLLLTREYPIPVSSEEYALIRSKLTDEHWEMCKNKVILNSNKIK